MKKNEVALVMASTPTKAEELSKKKKKKNGIPAIYTLNHNQPSCYGCGATIQTQESEAPGNIPPQTYEVKRKHHQLKTVLCGRCRLLSQGNMIPAVGGPGGYGSGKGFVLSEELRAQLSHLRHHKALIVKLVDIVDFNGSFLTRVRDLGGANPIIMVLTKGSANVGKSAFVTALLQEMAKRDPVAAAALRLKPIQSAMPGTTLEAIEFEAFSGGGKLFSTRGVHLHHRMAAVVDPKDVALLAPRRRLRGYVIGPRGHEEEEETEPEENSHLFEEGYLDKFLKVKLGSKKLVEDSVPLDMDEELDELDDGLWTEGNLSGTSLFWGGVVRIDIVKAPADLKLTFFGPSAIRIWMWPTEKADDFYEVRDFSTLWKILVQL